MSRGVSAPVFIARIFGVPIEAVFDDPEEA
jgi:hypothetical protein